MKIGLLILLVAELGLGQSAGEFFAREKAIWTSPTKMTAKRWGWVALLGAGTAGLVLGDVAMSRNVPHGETAVTFGRRMSRVGSSYGLLSLSAGTLALGAVRGDNKLKQTGWLAGEAAVHSIVLTYALKLAATRERPNLGSGRGHFYSGMEDALAGDNSFPSGHSMASWAAAAVVANQYREKPWVGVAAYGLAATVSASRVLAQRHYVSDVVVGGGIGYLVGRYVQKGGTKKRWQPQVTPKVGKGMMGVGAAWGS